MGRSVRLRSFVYIIIVGIFLTIAYSILTFGNYSDPRREIYFRHHSKVNCGYLFGYLPDNYNNHFSENIVNERDDVQVVVINFESFPTGWHPYVLIEGIDGKKHDEILFDSDSLYWHFGDTVSVLSSLVNLKLFNRYMDILETENAEQTERELYSLLGYLDQSKLQVITTESALWELVKIEKYPYEGDCYRILKENFQPDFDKYRYLWFDDFGLFEVSMNINGTYVEDFRDRFIFGMMYTQIVGSVDCDG